MRKLIIVLSALSLLFVLFTSCVSTETKVGKAGTLPKKWWTMDRGQLQNYYRGSSTGQEHKVVIFIGKSDSALNVDESTAIENARMDAFQLLSRYLSQKVTGIQQSGKHIQAIQDAVAKGKISQQKGDELKRKVEEKMSTYQASITSTQFSSFRQEGTYTEKAGNKYKGWVVYSMSDQILEETKRLQTAAFETLVQETAEYQEIMKTIQEVIASKMLETIMDEAGL